MENNNPRPRGTSKPAKGHDNNKKEHSPQTPTGSAQSPPSETGQQAHQRSASGSHAVDTGERITNEDRQHQVTNADKSKQSLGEEETEGDPEILGAYSNQGDRSAETEKKSATTK